MLCTGCGVKISEDPFCSKCGRARPSVEAATPPTTVTIEREAVLRKHGEAQFGVAIAFAFLLSLRFSIFGGLRWAETIGATIGTLLIPFVLGYVIGRKKGLNSIGNWTLVFVILVSVSANANRATKKRETAEQQAARIMNDVINKRPTQGNDEEQVLRGIFDEYLGDLKEIRQGYDRLQLANLYEAQTFSDSATLADAHNKLRTVEDLHRKSDELVPLFIEVADRHLRDAGVSAERRSRFVNAAAEDVKASSLKMLRWHQAEQVWIDNTRVLLDYADNHQDTIRVSNGRLLIADSDARQQFNLLWKSSAEAYDAMTSAATAQHAAAETEMKARGVDAQKLMKHE